MRFVIMANGHGTRWGGHSGIPKHLIEFEGETLLRRITRQLRALDPDAEVVISASNPDYETEGARRHTPRVNELEIDRFVRQNTINRFGPVREVRHEPQAGLVIEVAFEGLNRSTRHKSGLAMRFPRVARLRWDKPPAEADRIETLLALLPQDEVSAAT